MEWSKGEELNIQRPTFNVEQRTIMQNTQPKFDEIMIVRIPYWKLNVERSMLDVNLLFNQP